MRPSVLTYDVTFLRHVTSKKMKNIAITFEPEVVETSGWLQINPCKNTYREVISILYARRRFASRYVTTLRFFLQNKLKVKFKGQRSRSKVKVS